MKTKIAYHGIALVAAVFTAGGLSLFIVSPVAAAMQENEAKANCARVSLPHDQGLEISGDLDTGLVTIGYPEGGRQVTTQMYFASEDGFKSCTPSTKAILERVKLHADNMISGACTEVKDILDKKVTPSQADGRKFSIPDAQVFVKKWCNK